MTTSHASDWPYRETVLVHKWLEGLRQFSGAIMVSKTFIYFIIHWQSASVCFHLLHKLGLTVAVRGAALWIYILG